MPPFLAILKSIFLLVCRSSPSILSPSENSRFQYLSFLPSLKTSFSLLTVTWTSSDHSHLSFLSRVNALICMHLSVTVSAIVSLTLVQHSSILVAYHLTTSLATSSANTSFFSPSNFHILTFGAPLVCTLFHTFMTSHQQHSGRPHIYTDWFGVVFCFCLA